jgi:hypothetical protein
MPAQINDSTAEWQLSAGLAGPTLRAADEETINAALKLSKFRAAINVGSETQAARRAANACISNI